MKLVKPRYASLPNIMKAKKKPLDEKTAEDYGVDTNAALAVAAIACAFIYGDTVRPVNPDKVSG